MCDWKKKSREPHVFRMLLRGTWTRNAPMRKYQALSPRCTKIFSSYLIAPINKHRNSLMHGRVRIIRRFATERDTISLALGRKRSPIFPARRFVPSSPFGRAQSISESFATSRIRCKQVSAIFAGYDIKFCTCWSISSYLIKHCFFSVPKNCIAKGSRRNVNLIRSLSILPRQYSRQKYRLFKVRHSRLPAASKANEDVVGGDAEREEGEG